MVINTEQVFPEKTAVLTYSPPGTNQEARLLSIKGIPSVGPSFDTFGITCSTGVVFNGGFTSKTNIEPYYCANLMEYPSNNYNIVQFYPGLCNAFFLEEVPEGVTIVNVSGSNSIIFADLRTESKVFVLPPIETLTQSETVAPYFVLKDAYVSGGINPWFISTSGGFDEIDGQGTTLVFNIEGQAIELVGARVQGKINQWYILGGYGI